MWGALQGLLLLVTLRGMLRSLHRCTCPLYILRWVEHILAKNNTVAYVRDSSFNQHSGCFPNFSKAREFDGIFKSYFGCVCVSVRRQWRPPREAQSWRQDRAGHKVRKKKTEKEKKRGKERNSRSRIENYLPDLIKHI